MFLVEHKLDKKKYVLKKVQTLLLNIINPLISSLTYDNNRRHAITIALETN